MGNSSSKQRYEYKKGDVILIIDDPYASFQGTVIEVNNNILKVTVELMGRSTPMELNEKQVELVTS